MTHGNPSEKGPKNLDVDPHATVNVGGLLGFIAYVAPTPTIHAAHTAETPRDMDGQILTSYADAFTDPTPITSSDPAEIAALEPRKPQPTDVSVPDQSRSIIITPRSQ